MSKARQLAQKPNQPTGRKNIIINGAMNVAQRGTSSTTNGFGTVDRFTCAYGTGSITQSQESLSSSDDPYNQGFRSSFRATVTTASSDADSYIQIEQRIEAQNIAQSGWEYTNPNSYLTLSFWAKSSLAGTYYAQFRTVDVTFNYYNKSFTLAANVWSKVTCTIPGNANININNDNGEGFRILVIPDYGTTYSGHAEAVEDDWYVRSQVSGYTPSFTQDWQNTSNATFDLTGVQLEVGSTATEFEHRSYGEELALCQRYFQTFAMVVGRSASGVTPIGSIDIRPNMRAKPTATRLADTVSGNESGTTITPSFVTSSLATDAIQRVFFYNNTNIAAGGVGTFDAEL